MTKHTQGPWDFSASTYLIYGRGSEWPNNPRIVAEVRSNRAIADGQLLAAAPDMLEALETIAGGYTNRFPGAPDVMDESPDTFRHKMWSWSQTVARDAIAKATKESKA